MRMVQGVTTFLAEDEVAGRQLPLVPRHGQEILTKAALKMLFFTGV